MNTRPSSVALQVRHEERRDFFFLWFGLGQGLVVFVLSFAWSDAGIGVRRNLPAAQNSISSVVPLANRDLLVTAQALAGQIAARRHTRLGT